MLQWQALSIICCGLMFETWFRVNKEIQLKKYSDKYVLNALECICDIVRCTKENQIGTFQTGE